MRYARNRTMAEIKDRYGRKLITIEIDATLMRKIKPAKRTYAFELCRNILITMEKTLEPRKRKQAAQ